MIKKQFKNLSFILIFLCHLGFLATILIEKQNNLIVSAFLALALFLLFVTYKKIPISAKDNTLEHVLTVGFVSFGALATYVLHSAFGWSAVLASAFIGFVFSYIPNFNKESELLKIIPAAVFCGTFVGMTNTTVSQSYIFISVASVITGLLLVSSKNAFHGFGGKLGSMAFGGVVVTFLITYLLNQ